MFFEVKVVRRKQSKKESVSERTQNTIHGLILPLFILSYFSIFFNNFPLNFDVYYNWQKVVYLGRVKERKKNHIVFSFMFELEIHALDFNCYFPFMYSSSYNLPMIPNVCIMHSVSFIIFVSLPRFLIFMRCRNIYIYIQTWVQKNACVQFMQFKFGSWKGKMIWYFECFVLRRERRRKEEVGLMRERDDQSTIRFSEVPLLTSSK